MKAKRYKIGIKMKCNKTFKKKHYSHALRRPWRKAVRLWGQKELISLFAVYIFVVNISKELLYNAKTSHNEIV